MKFKERLDILNEIRNSEFEDDIILKEDAELTDIFENNPRASGIIQNIINQNKNIILFCSKEYDKSLLCNYFRLFLNKNDSIEILRNISDNLSYVSASKVIIPDPSIKDVIKILEYTLMGAKSFIFSMHVKNFKNILDSLRTLIALNFPYLSQSNIDHLIGSSEACLIFFTINECGLLSVNTIAQIKYNDNISLEILYTYNPNDRVEKREYEQELESSSIKTEEIKQNDAGKENIEFNQTDFGDLNESTIDSEFQLPVVPSEFSFNFKEHEQNEPEINQKTNDENVVLTNKINKYKLLKLKLKNKNSTNDII